MAGAARAGDGVALEEAFERKLTVLESRATIRWLTGAAVIGGPLLLALAATKIFPPGLFGLHLLIVGALARRLHARNNFQALRRERTVRVTAEGLHVDGVLTIPRATIASGYFQPRSGQNPGSSIRLVDRRKRILFEVESDEARAREILRVLRLDAGSKLAAFGGSSPLYATPKRNFYFVFGMMAAALVLTSIADSFGAARAALPAFVCAAAGIVLAALLPSRINIGADGVAVSWLWRKRFTPMNQIVSASAEGDRAIRLALASGATEMLYTSMARSRNIFASAHRDAVLARIREALINHRSSAPTADVAALVGRGARPRDEWLASLAKIREARVGYRDVVVRDDDLWKVVEDPTAPEDARAAAAMILRGTLDDAGRSRVRVAAEATASPKLRVALDAAATESDETVLEALEDLTERNAHRVG